jgi:hypothetical protein
MSTQGIGDTPTADVPLTLTQGPGSAAPSQLYGETGTLVPQSSLTALFDQNGNYVGSYGIDPDTGAFAAWNANGDEVSYQAFAAEHNIVNGATPISSTGGNAVLYNASGQIIGLGVAGYLVEVDDAAQNTTSPTDGLTDVYNRTGSQLIGSFGYSEADGELEINGYNAVPMLEQDDGFTAAQIANVDQSLQANGGWASSNTTDVSVEQALIEDELNQGDAVSQETISTAVYDADGNYVGSYGVNGGFVVYDQNGDVDNTPVLQDDDISGAQQSEAQQVLTSALPLAGNASNYSVLLQINQALASYLLAQGAAGSTLGNAVDVIDGSGNFDGNVGIDTATGQFAVEESGGTILDLNNTLASEYGLSATSINAAQQLWSAPSGVLSASQSALLSEVSTDLGAIAMALYDNPFANMSPSQVAALTPGQLSAFTDAQLLGLTAPQVNALSPTQIAAINVAGFSATTLAGLSEDTLQSFTSGQVAGLSQSQVQALGLSVDLFTPSQFASLSTGALDALTKSAIASLSSAQLQAINPGALWDVSPSQIALLTPAQLSSLTATQLGQLTPQQLSALSAAQIQVLNVTDLSSDALTGMYLSPEFTENLSSAQVSELSESQVSALGWGADYAFTPEQMEELQPTAIAGLDAELSVGQLEALTPAQISDLSTYEVATMNNADFPNLSASQIAALTGPQIQALDEYEVEELTNNPTQLQAFSAAQIASLAPSQMSYVEILNLSVTQAEALTASQAAALTASQLQSLNASITSEMTSLNMQGFNAATYQEVVAQAIIYRDVYPDYTTCLTQNCSGNFPGGGICGSNNCSQNDCGSNFCVAQFCTEQFACYANWCFSQGCNDNTESNGDCGINGPQVCTSLNFNCLVLLPITPYPIPEPPIPIPIPMPL